MRRKKNKTEMRIIAIVAVASINIPSDSFYILNSRASWQRYKSLLNNNIIGEQNWVAVINHLMEYFLQNAETF